MRIERNGDKVWLRHDPVSTGWGYMSPDVLIEFGGRSTGLPAEIMPITCYAASELPALTFPTAEPRVMRIGRTFWEKATAVHVFCKADTLTAERLARHWYDLVRLDDTGYATTALADRNIARQVAAHKTAFFAAKGVDYAAAVAGDLQLVPSGMLTNLLRADYQAMLDNGLLNVQAPSFEQIDGSVTSAAEPSQRHRTTITHRPRVTAYRPMSQVDRSPRRAETPDIATRAAKPCPQLRRHENRSA